MELAPYACHAEQSRGRRYEEPESATRSCFQRDRDRIIHSAPFRRLEYKTQVFVNHEGDHYRTRLTHTLEVAQLARSLCRSLKLNEDLAETLALAHDLGHPPYGHAGEDALKDCMKPYGGWNHNGHTLKLVTKLEQRYASFDGLNLTWETLEGIAKHNGPLKNPPKAIAEYDREQSLELDTYASMEAQAAALADDIAYNNHDLDDGLRARLFTIEELYALPLVGDTFREVRRIYPNIDNQRWIHESNRRLIQIMVDDLLAETRGRVMESGVDSVAQVRAQSRPLTDFSDGMKEVHKELRAFLMERMYRHWRVNRMTSKARRTVTELFGHFMEEPCCLPAEWQAGLTGEAQPRAMRISDYIAGMTDRFAQEEHRRLFDIGVRS